MSHLFGGLHFCTLSLCVSGGEFGDWSVQGTWSSHGPDMNGLGWMAGREGSLMAPDLKRMGDIESNSNPTLKWRIRHFFHICSATLKFGYVY